MKKQVPTNCEEPLIDEDLTKKKQQSRELEDANRACLSQI